MKINRILNVALLALLCGCSPQTSEDNSINDSSNVESTSENQSSEITTPTKKRVVLLGIDGAGHNFNSVNTPQIMEIFNGYATGNEILSANPTISAQSWGSMLTGVIPSQHNFTNDSIAVKRNLISEQYPSIFKQIYMQDADAQLASFVNWNPINYGIVEEGIGVFKYNNDSDENVAENIIAYLEDFDPTFIFAQFDSADHAGHANGYTSSSYYNALKALDSQVSAIYQKIVDMGWEDDTLFLVTTDHGGKNQSHGGYSNDEKYNFFGARNKNVNHMTINNMFIRDIPAIVAHHLNIDIAPSMDSIVPEGLFKDKIDYETRRLKLNNQALIAPSLNDDKGLLKYFNKEDIRLFLQFEDNSNDAMGHYQVTTRNNDYVKGVSGKAIHVSNLNYLTIEDLLFENKSFTIASFINYNASTGDPCFFSNKDWASGLNDGMAYSMRSEDMKFNVGAGKQVRSDVTLHYPGADHANNWQHLAISYDAKTSILSFYVNFSLEYVYKLESGRSFDSNYQFNIGQDGTGKFNAYAFNLLVDDFIIFNKSFDKEDCLNLKNYYNQLLK